MEKDDPTFSLAEELKAQKRPKKISKSLKTELSDEEARKDIILRTKHALSISEQFTEIIVKRMEKNGSFNVLQSQNLVSSETSESKAGSKRKSVPSKLVSKDAKKRKGNNGDILPNTYVNAKNFVVPTRQPHLLEGAVMRDYQLEGLEWLMALDCNGANGILADEMGLGKTLQVIALISFLVEQGVGAEGPFLVIGPVSTLHNWVDEFKKFAPKIPVTLFHGSKDARNFLKKDILKLTTVSTVSNGEPKDVPTYPVIITSYSIILKDLYLSKINWRYLIVDEAHRLKNCECLLIKKLREFSSTNRLLLTGTPLQNNMTELWSLLNFILPTIVTDLALFESWFDPTLLDSSNVKEKIVEAEEKDQIITTLHKILKPFLLRRVKSDVGLDLPPKKEIVVYAQMTKWQQKLYSAVVDKTLQSLQGRQPAFQDPVAIEKSIRLKRSTEEKVPLVVPVVDGVSASKRRSTRKSSVKSGDYKLLACGIPINSFQEAPQFSEQDGSASDEICDDKLLKGLAEPNEELVPNMKTGNPVPVLRQICNHPYLACCPCIPGTKMMLVNENIVQRSGKMQVLDAMLTRLKKNGHKVLIFSNFTKMLDIIEDYLHFRMFEYTRLDGTCSIEVRQENILKFNSDSDVFVFLISTRAGGLGINLVAADTVIIFDSDWNPQADLQAQDRCHRIGQTRPVVVYRFVVRNSIDQQIIVRADKKKQLDKVIIQHGKFKNLKENESVSLSELRELLETKCVDEVPLDNGLIYTEGELDSLCDRDVVFPAEEKDKAVSEELKETDELLGISEESDSIDSADYFSSHSGATPASVNCNSKALKSGSESDSAYSEVNSDSRFSNID